MKSLVQSSLKMRAYARLEASIPKHQYCLSLSRKSLEDSAGPKEDGTQV